MTAGELRERVAFDLKVETPDGKGGRERSWSPVHECAAEFRYLRGGETVQAGGLSGTASFKVRVRSCVATRALTPGHRMRDARRGTVFNIREIDAVSDPAFVWLVAQSGVAV